MSAPAPPGLRERPARTVESGRPGTTPARARGSAVETARTGTAGGEAVPPPGWRPARFALALAAGLAAGLGTPGEAWAARPVEPISFARGASSAVVRGAVVRGERALYSVEARAGQRMSVRISAVERNAAFQVYAPGAEVRTGASGVEVVGEALPGAGEGDDATRWAGTLPRAGAYTVVVGPTRGNATYRLTVAVR